MSAEVGGTAHLKNAKQWGSRYEPFGAPCTNKFSSTGPTLALKFARLQAAFPILNNTAIFGTNGSNQERHCVMTVKRARVAETFSATPTLRAPFGAKVAEAAVELNQSGFWSKPTNSNVSPGWKHSYIARTMKQLHQKTLRRDKKVARGILYLRFTVLYETLYR